MKFHLLFVLLSLEIGVHCLGKKSALQKVFSSIVDNLVKRNYLVSFIAKANKSGSSTMFERTAKVPHIVIRPKNFLNKFWLNSSAIVLLGSVGMLEQFNKVVTLPAEFSDPQQVFIYCGGRRNIHSPANFHVFSTRAVRLLVTCGSEQI